MTNSDTPPYLKNRLRRAFYFVQRHRFEDGAMARALLQYWLRQVMRELGA